MVTIPLRKGRSHVCNIFITEAHLYIMPPLIYAFSYVSWLWIGTFLSLS
jgi:hypothetical protein